MISADLTARAGFLSQLHRMKSIEEWFIRIIQERIELEETAFIGVKQDFSVKSVKKNGIDK